MEFFGPDKADIIYDCAGNDITMGQAIQYARKGSTIILVAVFAGMAKVDLAVLNDHELDLNTSMMYRSEDYEKAIELADDLGVRIIQLAGYDVYYDPSTPETVARFGENLKKCTLMAARAGVLMGLKPWRQSL